MVGVSLGIAQYQKPVIAVVEAKEPTVYELVKEAFPNNPTMVAIAKCESTFRQFNKDGTVLRGEENPEDVGIFQINEHWHLEDSKLMGFDIHTPLGNIGYAKYLYKTQGVTPWNWSRPMWEHELKYGTCNLNSSSPDTPRR